MSAAGGATLVELLERARDDSGSGLRLLDRRERATRLSWSELADRAAGVAAALAELGVERGERVALLYPTGAEFFAALFGTLLAGAVPAPLYPPVRLGRLAEYHRRTAAMLRAAAARLVLADASVRRLLGESIAAAAPALGCRSLAELPRAGELWRRLRADELGLVQFSSGTTVDPKPVALSHRALVAQVETLNGFWPDREDLRHSGVSWLPLYHDMGLIGCVFPALGRRTDLTLIPPELFVARPAVWLRALSRYRATVSPAPNFAYGLCVEKVRDDELDGVDLSSWRVALNGAETVSAETARRFTARFARWGFRREAMTPVYGLSEAALAVTFSALDRPFRSARFDRAALAGRGVAEPEPGGVELVSLGRPLPGFELSLRGGDGAEVAESHVGRVWVRGPSLMSGYLGRPQATAEAIVDGWLDTGDLGFLRDGELFLTGRAKDIVIVRGRNYPPDELEHAVEGVPGFRAGCAVAVSHRPESGEREEVLLLVEHRRGATPRELEELPEACRQAVVAATGIEPDRVLALPPGTLPRTSSGKMRRREALARLLEERLDEPERMNAWRLARAMLDSRRALRRAARRG